MTHPKYGNRFTCFQCSVKFYDLGKEEPICPKCGADQRKAPKKPSSKPAKAVVIPDYDNDDTDDDTDTDTDGADIFIPGSGGGFETDEMMVDDIPDEDD